MNEKTKRLQELQEQKSRKAHLESLRAELTRQQRELSEKTVFLKAAMVNEQKDVDRLEKGGLVAIVYELMGKKEQKLEKEQKEARAARLKYETALREQEAVEARLRRANEEYRTVRDCEKEYNALLDVLLSDIRSSDDIRSEEVLRLERQIGEHNEVIREIAEAIGAGNEALSAADTVLHHLSDAEGWGTWDILGGGLLADIAKHEALDAAQRAVNVLQVKLRSFKTELVDVNVEANVQISMDGFLGFADFFFDGFFADFAAMEHIERATAEVRVTKEKIKGILDTLRAMQKEREAAVHSLREQLAQLVMR